MSLSRKPHISAPFIAEGKPGALPIVPASKEAPSASVVSPTFRADFVSELLVDSARVRSGNVQDTGTRGEMARGAV